MSAAALWTGGKDSSLALYESRRLGCTILCLVTFVPCGAKFRAHPLDFLKYQSEALGLPHYTIRVDEPFTRSYRDAILSLKSRFGIDTLITGDIAEVDGFRNWIRMCSENSGVNVLTPLWHRNRVKLLNRLLELEFKVIFSCVKGPWFTEEWLGKRLTETLVRRLCELNAKTGLDICGEQGEYHTLVLDAPQFKKSIHVGSFSKQREGSLMYIKTKEITLREKHFTDLSK